MLNVCVKGNKSGQEGIKGGGNKGRYVRKCIKERLQKKGGRWKIKETNVEY